MIEVRKAEDRGLAKFSWLTSHHTFSFGSYFDPRFMGVSALRVINDDYIHPGTGFDTHGHQDMEILTYVLAGVIEHKDSMGNLKHITAGEFQLMSAGTGITHSEYNGSNTELLHLLQIWIMPDTKNLTPSYQQKSLNAKEAKQLIVSPNGQDDSFTINQDAYLYRLLSEDSQTSVQHELKSDRSLYIHLIRGGLKLGNETTMQAGDGVTISKDAGEFAIELDADSEALLFDLP